jgi:hypothetical protein
MRLYTKKSTLSSWALPIWGVWTHPKAYELTNYRGTIILLGSRYNAVIKIGGEEIILPPRLTLRGARKSIERAFDIEEA